MENFGKEKKMKEKPFNIEEIDAGVIPELASKCKEDGNLELHGNENEVLVEVWQLPVCTLLALMFLSL
jgi:hypothetical protein